MVVIKVEPYDNGQVLSPTPPRSPKSREGETPFPPTRDMFGFQDLASDYYQVGNFINFDLISLIMN